MFVTKNRILSNASWIIICRIFQAILNLIISMMTARYFGPSNYGLINYAASVVAFFIPIMQLGLRSTLVQEYIQNKENEGVVLGTSTALMALSAFFCMIGVTSFVMISNSNEKETIIVCALYSGVLIFQAFEMIQYWFQYRLLSKYTSIVSLCAYVVVAIYKLLLFVYKKNIYWFAVSYVLDSFLISVALFLIYKRVGSSKITVSMRLAKSMLAKSKYYIVSSMMVTAFGHIGSIMLELICDKEAVGIYTAAITCAGMTSFVFTAIIDSARPVILSYYSSDYVKFKKSMEVLYSLIFYTSLCQSILICLLSPIIIKILYGYSYVDAIQPLRIIAWYTIFSYLGPVRNIWILAEGKQKYLWIINLLGAIMSAFLNLLLIPILDVSGAAISILLTQVFTNVIVSFFIKPLRENNVLMLNGLIPHKVIGNVKYFIKK